MGLKRFYFEEHRKLVLIPILMILFSAIVLINSYQSTGEWIGRDIDLEGGSIITIQDPDIDSAELLLGLQNEFGDFFTVAFERKTKLL